VKLTPARVGVEAIPPSKKSGWSLYRAVAFGDCGQSWAQWSLIEALLKEREPTPWN
jgi:hypothetical protein